MKVLLKKVVFRIFNFLSNFVNIKKDVNIFDLDIVILFQKPLGIGDFVILSPFIRLIDKNISNKIFLITEYPIFIEFENIIWVTPKDFKKDLKSTLVISPTLTWSHLKYIFKSSYFLGYFLTNRLFSNISNLKYEYNPQKEHYLEKIFPILQILKIKYNKDFLYPKIITKEFNFNFKKYVVISPYSLWNTKQYPLQNYVEIIKNILVMTDYQIILVGSNLKNEMDYNKELENVFLDSRIINLTGTTTILELSYIIKNSILYIGNDSGPSNIAYVLSNRSLVFFGPVNFEYILPLNEKLKKNIQALDSRKTCEFFPCYDGYNKPKCINSIKFSCISQSFIEHDKLKNLLKD